MFKIEELTQPRGYWSRIGVDALAYSSENILHVYDASSSKVATASFQNISTFCWSDHSEQLLVADGLDVVIVSRDISIIQRISNIYRNGISPSSMYFSCKLFRDIF